MILTIHFICILNQGLRLTTEPFHADHIYISLGLLRDSLARLLCTHASQFSAPMLQMARFPSSTLAQPPIPFQIAIDSYKIDLYKIGSVHAFGTAITSSPSTLPFPHLLPPAKPLEWRQQDRAKKDGHRAVRKRWIGIMNLLTREEDKANGIWGRRWDGISAAPSRFWYRWWAASAGGGISGFRLDNTIPFISVTSTIPSIGNKPERR